MSKPDKEINTTLADIDIEINKALKNPSPMMMYKMLEKYTAPAKEMAKGSDQINKIGVARDKNGNTLLHALLIRQHKEGSNGQTPEYCDLVNKAINTLFKNGVDVNAANNEGYTALSIAMLAAPPPKEIVNNLIDKGAVIPYELAQSPPSVSIRSAHQTPEQYDRELKAAMEHHHALKSVADRSEKQVREMTKKELAGIVNEPALLEIIADFKPAVAPTKAQFAAQKKSEQKTLEQAMFGDVKNSRDGSRAPNSRPPSRSPSPRGRY